MPMRLRLQKQSAAGEMFEAMIEDLNTEIEAFYAPQPVVFGDGAVGARVMLLGEAPGKDEVLPGRPFVAQTGKNLAEFLEVLGITREEV